MGDILLANALAIKGWMSPTELEWIARNAQKCQKIIEVGSFKGRSTRAFCDNCPGTVLAVDPWDGPYITHHNKVLFDQAESWPEFQQNLAGVTNLKIFKGTFDDFALINKEKDFDLVFIDGDHRYETVIRDINYGLQILKSGGILSGHDYTHPDWPGVREAVDVLLPHKEVLNSIWWITKS